MSKKEYGLWLVHDKNAMSKKEVAVIEGAKDAAREWLKAADLPKPKTRYKLILLPDVEYVGSVEEEYEPSSPTKVAKVTCTGSGYDYGVWEAYMSQTCSYCGKILTVNSDGRMRRHSA